MTEKYQILVVDDEESVRAGYDHALAEFPDAKIHLASNRDEALRILEGFRLLEGTRAQLGSLIAVAFIDQRLGDFNPKKWPNDIDGAEGITLIPYIKQRICPLTRVIMVTAFAGTEEDKGYYAGLERADGYMGKAKSFQTNIHDTYRKAVRDFERAVESYNLELEG
ncbi:hypothetical protein [Endothiovibrio diazotrophicus]